MTTTQSIHAAETRSRRGALHRFLRDPFGLGASILLLLIIVACLAAPLLSPYDPNFTSFDLVFAPPSAAHPLGGDGVGRDELARLLWGGRTSLLAGAIVLVVASTLGVTLGLIAGYAGGIFDTVGSWIANALMALPGIIILMASAAALGRSIWISMTIFGILLSPGFYRMTRTNVRAVRNDAYVDAARVFGISPTRILFRHILTVVRGPLLIQIAGAVGIAVVIQAGLDFLGLGDPTLPSWGGMLADAFRTIYTAPLLILWPGLMIGLTAGAAALIGNSLRDVLEEGDVVRVSPGAVRAARRQQQAAAASQATVADDPSELLSVEDLRVSYQLSRAESLEVVHGVDLSIRRGEVLGLVGESGSGKTQTSLSVLGLLPEGGFISGGRVSFNGLQISGISPREMRGLLGKKITYIPQEPMTNLDPMFTIGSQLIERLRSNTSLSREEASAKMLHMLDRVGIVDPQRVMASHPHQVSGGMAQRVLIAGALAVEPDLIIADEPSTALDVTVQAEVLDLLRELQRESHSAMLLISHNFGVVADICDKVAVMQSGVIVEQGPVRELFANPQHPYTRSLLAASLEGRPARSEASA